MVASLLLIVLLALQAHVAESVWSGGVSSSSRVRRARGGDAWSGRPRTARRFQPGQGGGVDFSHVAMKSVPFKTCSLSDANCKVVEPVFSATVSLGASSNGTSACVPPRTDHPTALETSTAYCVFKHLPRDAFWVNLNPNEPDRVMDARMARTESGRLLLESDLWLKKTAAIYLHPDHALGSAFWKRVYGQVGRGRDGRLCYSLRQWIVPGAIQIAHVVGRGKGGEAGRGAEVTVHLIQARMAVRHESAFEEVRPPRHGVSSDRSRSADDPKLVALPSSLPLRYRFHRFSLSLSLSLSGRRCFGRRRAG